MRRLLPALFLLGCEPTPSNSGDDESSSSDATDAESSDDSADESSEASSGEGNDDDGVTTPEEWTAPGSCRDPGKGSWDGGVPDESGSPAERIPEDCPPCPQSLGTPQEVGQAECCTAQSECGCGANKDNEPPICCEWGSSPEWVEEGGPYFWKCTPWSDEVQASFPCGSSDDCPSPGAQCCAQPVNPGDWEGWGQCFDKSSGWCQ